MPATVNIPSNIYNVGSQVYGPVTLDPTDSQIQVTLDRTVTQGMNSKTTSTTVQALFEVQMPDNPGAWLLQGLCTFQGGIRTDPDTGQPLDHDGFGCSLWNQGVTGRSLRLTLTVAGTSVRLGGTLAVT
jgi:hypothetical protein